MLLGVTQNSEKGIKMLIEKKWMCMEKVGGELLEIVDFPLNDNGYVLMGHSVDKLGISGANNTSFLMISSV